MAFTKIGDIKGDDNAVKAAEAAYRRGYQQGVNQVLDAIEAGFTINEISDWQNGALTEWRNRKTPGTQPPAMPRKGSNVRT